MIPVEPEKQSNELLDRLNAHQSGDVQLSEFELVRIRREAEKLLSVDPVRANEVLGAIACIEGDLASARKYHQRAVDIAPTDLNALKNFATSLINLGEHQEAVKYLLQAHRFHEGHPAVLRWLIAASLLAGRVRDAKEWLNKWTREHVNETHPDEELIVDLVWFALHNDVADTDIQAMLSIANEVLGQHGHHSCDVSPRLAEDEEGEWLSYVIGVDAPPHELIELNVNLSERMSKDVPAAIREKVTVRYSANTSDQCRQLHQTGS